MFRVFYSKNRNKTRAEENGVNICIHDNQYMHANFIKMYGV